MIFSIVRVVDPGAVCSHRRGRTEVEFFACGAVDDIGVHRQAAHGYASECQHYYAGRDVQYIVEEFATDDDAGRAPNEMMRRDMERATA